MEDTLREGEECERCSSRGLNPCSNGRYSQRVIDQKSAAGATMS